MSDPSDTPKTSAMNPVDAISRALSTNPAQRVGETNPVSWAYQFSWHGSESWSYEKSSKTLSDGYLAHGNATKGKESYNHFFPSTRGHQEPEFVNQGSSGWYDHSSTGSTTESSAVAKRIDPISSGIPTHSGIMGSNTATEPQSPNLGLDMQDCAGSIVEILVDDFLRSHAPDGSKRRTAGTSQEDAESVSDNRTIRGQGDGDRATSRKRKTLGGGSGGSGGGNEDESEDESSQDKKQKSYHPDKDRDSRRWACPFAKWKPKVYTCNVRPKEIKDLKGHIFRVHWKEHCDKCLTVYPKGQNEMGHICHPLDPGSIAPPGFITRRRKAEISERERSSLSHEDQWYRIYGVLFPGERRCYNPYVNKSADEHLGRAEGYFRSERSQRILDQELRKRGFEGDIRKRVEEMIHDGFLARMIQEYDPNDEDSFTPAQRVLQEDSTAQSSQVEGCSTETTAPELVPEPVGEVPTLNHAEFGVLPDLNQADDILQLVEPETFNTYFGDLFEPYSDGRPDLWYDNFEIEGNQVGLMSGTSRFGQQRGNVW